MESQKIFSVILVLGVVSVFANVSYEGDNGPSHWAEEYPSCGGNAQSPININSEKSKFVWRMRQLKFHKYGAALSGSFVNNGHSMQFNPTDSPVQVFRGGPLNGEYQFTQFHFHWGSDDTVGSEHTVDDFRFPLEMHLVHTNTKYADNATEALYNDDGLAVIGIFGVVLPDYTNEAFETVVNAARALSEEGPGEAEVEATLVLDDFLNEVVGLDYFSYSGSLTTPGCNEVVSWIVMDMPIFIGESQIAALRSLVTENGENLVNNFRPTQKLNNRIVRRVF